MTLTIQGCAVSERIVYVKPECSAPDHEPLRNIKATTLWDDLVDNENDEEGKKLYDDLVYNQRVTVDWALSMESMINNVLCKKAGE